MSKGNDSDDFDSCIDRLSTNGAQSHFGRSTLPSRSCRNGKRKKISIQACKIASVLFPAQHRVAQDFSHPSELFPAAVPAWISNREVQQLQGPQERFFAQFRILPVPSMSTGDLAPDIGQLFDY